MKNEKQMMDIEEMMDYDRTIEAGRETLPGTNSSDKMGPTKRKTTKNSEQENQAQEEKKTKKSLMVAKQVLKRASEKERKDKKDKKKEVIKQLDAANVEKKIAADKDKKQV